MIATVTLIAVVAFAYALVSHRLASTVITAPIFFAGVGFLVGPVLGIARIAPNDDLLVLLLEAALVMVLFADASSLDVRRWTREPGLSGRLLGVGLPLTMVAGGLVAYVVLPGLQWWEAALIGAMLAPTDAALGQAVVANPRVPAVVRNALNVESGLNDGLALPFVTILITVGLVAGGAEGDLNALGTLALALVGSTAIGLVTGLGGGWLIRLAAQRGLGDPRWLPIGLAMLAFATFSIADEAGASGFLAVWVAGLATGNLVRDRVEASVFSLPEQFADALAAVGFLLLGTALVGPILGRATPLTVLYAILSLTVVRILPVVLAMAGSGFSPATMAYIGWFGPRGLASIVFAGAVVEAAIPSATAITDVVLLTVVISLVVHGVTAAWGARGYAAWFDRRASLDPSVPEAAEIEEPAIVGDRRAGASPNP